MKKISLLLVSLLIISSCSSCKKFGDSFKKKDDQVSTANLEAQPQVQPYETVKDEKQAAALNQEQASQKEVQVEDRVFFAFDSNQLSADAQKALGLQVEWLKADPSIKVIVEGHTDERGTREYNIALGERRAKAVKDFLVKHDIKSSRIKIVSYGKERPAYLGSGEEIWTKNRRAVTAVDGQQ